MSAEYNKYRRELVDIYRALTHHKSIYSTRNSLLFLLVVRTLVLSSPSGSPSFLGGVKGKGERENMFIPLTFNLSPFPSPHLTILGWQTTSVCKRELKFLLQTNPIYLCQNQSLIRLFDNELITRTTQP